MQLKQCPKNVQSIPHLVDHHYLTLTPRKINQTSRSGIRDQLPHSFLSPRRRLPPNRHEHPHPPPDAHGFERVAVIVARGAAARPDREPDEDGCDRCGGGGLESITKLQSLI